MKLFDVGILEGDHISPMHREIKRSSGDWWTRCITFMDERGNIWDPRAGGIHAGNIKDYGGREIEIFRYKYPLAETQLLSWVERTVAECEGYDLLAILGFITGEKSFQDSNRWYCSEWPYSMLQDNGYPLTRVKKAFIFPNFYHYHNDYELIANFVIEGSLKVQPDFPEMSIPG